MIAASKMEKTIDNIKFKSFQKDVVFTQRQRGHAFEEINYFMCQENQLLGTNANQVC